MGETQRLEFQYGGLPCPQHDFVGRIDKALYHDFGMGHAGALVLHADGWIEGGEDPRSDGCVAAW